MNDFVGISPSESPHTLSEDQAQHLPTAWRIVKLGDVLREHDLRAGDDPRAADLPVLSLTKNRGLIPQGERFKKRIATENTNKYKIVARGEVVYNPYVIWEGAVHALRNPQFGLVSPVYVVWEVIPEIADPYFIDALLRTPIAIAAYNRLAAGAVNRRRSIRKTDFLGIEFPLPPLEEQRGIVGILETVRRAKDTTEKVFEAGHELKKSLMRHLFGFGPIPLRRAANQVPAETRIGAIADHWSVGKIGDYTTLCQYGLNLRGNANGKYPVLRMNNLQDGRVQSNELQYVDLDPEGFEKFRLQPGDILFNRTNSAALVGKTAIFEQSGAFVFASYLIRTRLDAEHLDPYYLNYYLNAPDVQTRLRSFASRAVNQSNINATKLRNFDIAVPPASEQRGTAAILRALDAKLQAEERRVAALSELFRSLVSNLVSGNHQLADAGIMVNYNGARG